MVCGPRKERVGEIIDLFGTSDDSPVVKRILAVGRGDRVGANKEVTLAYKLQCYDLSAFQYDGSTDISPSRDDHAQRPFVDAATGGPPTTFVVGSGVIEGWSDVVATMRVGEQAEVWIKPEKVLFLFPFPFPFSFLCLCLCLCLCLFLFLFLFTDLQTS